MSAPVTSLITYRPKKGRERELELIVLQHFPVLSGLGLVTRVSNLAVWTRRSIAGCGGAA